MIIASPLLIQIIGYFTATINLVKLIYLHFEGLILIIPLMLSKLSRTLKITTCHWMVLRRILYAILALIADPVGTHVVATELFGSCRVVHDVDALVHILLGVGAAAILVEGTLVWCLLLEGLDLVLLIKLMRS